MAGIYNDEKWIGQKFNMLTVEEAVKRSDGWSWRMKCECGGETVARPIDVISGKYVSCGCRRKNRKGIPLTHGMSHTPLHNIWCGMNNRCNPNHKSAKGYGKRGITICKEWASFENFRDWALQNGYEEGLTIERKDVNGNYCPENCTWITLAKQARNRRTTRWVEYQGRTMSLAEAAEFAGLPYKQVHFRLKKGWSLERALSEPVHHYEDSLKRKCDKVGIDYHTVYGRIHTGGWTEEEALNTPTIGIGANQTSYIK